GEVAPLLFKLTTIALRRGEQEVAVRLGAAAARLFQAQGDLRQSQAVEAAVAPAVRALPEKVAWEAWTEGWARSPAEAAGRAGAGVFAAALVVEWRALARKPGKLPAWLRFLLGWALVAAACWLVVVPALEDGIGRLLRLDSLAILVLALAAAALVLGSGRLAG